MDPETRNLIGLFPAIVSATEPEATEFSRLSLEAQDLIVRAATGQFEDGPPADIPESVRAEILAWASAPD